ncbi:enoyl-CoA hydratase-related protein [Prauserella oleivorans]|uniref:Enoyl-CoA hydratase-related protein n=1 Tax=Prauserella oleivorans TaxID=1478153 RepID=A0ABW5W9G0_9PSEU
MSNDAHDYTEIAYSVTDGIATIVLDRPARLNAFTETMAHELASAFARADAADDVRVVIVTGRGRAFCAGADLGRGAGTFDAGEAAPEFGQVDGVPRDAGGVVALAIAGCRKPVIGAVNGAAVGVGATMTLPMDIRIAADTARFGFVFARRGLVPEAGSSWFLPRVVGISQAMEWVATGRVFDAEEALAGRLVSRVTKADELLPTAVALAREIADNTSAVSVAASRRLLWSMLGAGSPWDAHRADSQLIHALGKGVDVAEGVTSFLEKRPPRFPGRVSKDMPDCVPEWPAPPEDS